jgi:hypothetical protein
MRPKPVNLRCSGRNPIVTAPGAPSNGNATDPPGAHDPAPRLAADHVDRRRPDKPGDEQALRPAVEVVRRADLLDAAAPQADDAVGHRRRLDLVVGDEDRRNAELFQQRFDLGPHGQPLCRIEIGKRLVEEQQLRLLHHRAGECDPLQLAAPTTCRASRASVESGIGGTRRRASASSRLAAPSSR